MKAILVIDMPNCCLDCPCYNKSKLYCQVINEMFTDEISNKPEWCPIKHLPEKRKLQDPFIYNGMNGTLCNHEYWENLGWNTCVNEITGEEK